MPTNNTITIQKITQPFNLETLRPFVQKYYEKVKVPGVSAESLWTYFVHIVENGGDLVEFNVAYINNEPKGFAVWGCMGEPHFGKAHCDHMYIWGKDKRIIEELGKKMHQYAIKHRRPLIDAVAINEAAFRRFKQVAKKVGLEVVENERKNFLLWRKQP